MALVMTKGYVSVTNGIAEFTDVSSTWFFEYPYWNNDGNTDFAIKVENTGNTTELLSGLDFTFLVACSGTTSFTSSNGTAHIASGNGCTMSCSVEYKGETYSASKNIPGKTRSNIVYSSQDGQSYFEPRPGDLYTFLFNKGLKLEAGDTIFVRFKATFDTSRSGENCIQISSQDTITAAIATVWRYNKSKGKWEKVLTPKRYDASTKQWVEMPIHIL